MVNESGTNMIQESNSGKALSNARSQQRKASKLGTDTIAAEIYLKEVELSEGEPAKKVKSQRRRRTDSERRHKSRSHSRQNDDDSEESSCNIFWTQLSHNNWHKAWTKLLSNVDFHLKVHKFKSKSASHSINNAELTNKQYSYYVTEL